MPRKYVIAANWQFVVELFYVAFTLLPACARQHCTKFLLPPEPRNITLVIGTIWSLCSCYKADITFHSMCSSSIKNQLKAPSNRRNFATYKEIGVKQSNADHPMSNFFYRNRLNRHLCACAVKTQLEVAIKMLLHLQIINHFSLHAKFRTLLLTVTVVDFGTYSHI